MAVKRRATNKALQPKAEAQTKSKVQASSSSSSSKKNSVTKQKTQQQQHSKSKQNKSLAASHLGKLVPALCALLAFGLYLRSTWICKYPYDDDVAVNVNPDVLNSRNETLEMSPWSSIWHHDFWGTDIHSPKTHKSYRPLVVSSYRLDLLLSGRRRDGNEVYYFHFINTLLYSLTVWVVVHVMLKSAVVSEAKRGSGEPAVLKRSRDLVVVLLPGLWFAAHPVHVESVAGLVGRAEILASLFCLLGTKFYRMTDKVHTVGFRWLITLGSSVAFFAAACLCKETAVVMPFVVAIVDVTSRWATLKGSSAFKLEAGMYRILSMMGVSLGYLFFRSQLFAKSATGGVVSKTRLEDNFLQHLQPMDKFRTALFIQVKYLQLLLWPSKLSCDYSLGVMKPVSNWLSTEMALVGVVLCAIAAFAAIGLVRLRNYKDATLLLALGWTFAPLVPASHIVDIGTVMGERLLFMPSIGMATLICSLFGLLSKTHKYSFLVFALPLVGSIVWSGRKTYMRVPDWTDSITILEADLLTYPNSLKLLLMSAMLERNTNEPRAFERSKAAQDLTDSMENVLIKGPYANGLLVMAHVKARPSRWTGANLTESMEYADRVLSLGFQNSRDWYMAHAAKGGALLRKALPTSDKELLTLSLAHMQTAMRNDKDGKGGHPIYCDMALALMLLKKLEDSYHLFQDCFERHARYDFEVSIHHLTNYASVMTDLSGAYSNDAAAAATWGPKAIEAMNMIVSHPNANEAQIASYTKNRQTIEDFMVISSGNF